MKLNLSWEIQQLIARGGCRQPLRQLMQNLFFPSSYSIEVLSYFLVYPRKMSSLEDNEHLFCTTWPAERGERHTTAATSSHTANPVA